MIKEVIRYQASDGSEWNTIDAADKQNNIITAVKKAMRPLGKEYKDPGCNFANGGGFVQHNVEAVVLATKNLVSVTEPLYGKITNTAHPTFYLRLIDSSHTALERAWGRLLCTDEKTGREYGQPYFRLHPEECNNKMLEDRR